MIRGAVRDPERVDAIAATPATSMSSVRWLRSEPLSIRVTGFAAGRIGEPTVWPGRVERGSGHAARERKAPAAPARLSGTRWRAGSGAPRARALALGARFWCRQAAGHAHAAGCREPERWRSAIQSRDGEAARRCAALSGPRTVPRRRCLRTPRGGGSFGRRRVPAPGAVTATAGRISRLDDLAAPSGAPPAHHLLQVEGDGALHRCGGLIAWLWSRWHSIVTLTSSIGVSSTGIPAPPDRPPRVAPRAPELAVPERDAGGAVHQFRGWPACAGRHAEIVPGRGNGAGGLRCHREQHRTARHQPDRHAGQQLGPARPAATALPLGPSRHRPHWDSSGVRASCFEGAARRASPATTTNVQPAGLHLGDHAPAIASTARACFGHLGLQTLAMSWRTSSASHAGCQSPAPAMQRAGLWR